MKKRNIFFTGLLLITAFLLIACGGQAEELPEESEEPIEAATSDENTTITDSGLAYTLLEEGDGPMPLPGDVVVVHYTGTLEDGTVFDSSYNRGEPFSFTLGQGQVIQGWDEGIALMSVGEEGILTIPPDLGYGDQGAGADIPPGATLIFRVMLVDVVSAEAESDNEETQFVYNEEDMTRTDSGLGYLVVEQGDGATPQAGDVVIVHYRGTLEDGTEFDSSYSRGEPFSFTLGQGQVIRGWDEGIALMSVGEKAVLNIPPDLGYGDRGAGNVIPPGATLIFEVELVGIQ